MREVAQHLEQIADALPLRDRSRRLYLRHNADRLKSAADLLTAEVNAGDPKTTGLTARVGKVALLAVGAVLVPMTVGAVEGASSALAQEALKAQERSLVCVLEVEDQAEQGWMEFDEHLSEEIENLRLVLTGLGTHPSSTIRSERSLTIVEENGLRANDLRVPNRRQRLVYLQRAVDQYRPLVDELDDPTSTASEIQAIEARIADARNVLEVVAAHDESLYPPQPIAARSDQASRD